MGMVQLQSVLQPNQHHRHRQTEVCSIVYAAPGLQVCDESFQVPQVCNRPSPSVGIAVPSATLTASSSRCAAGSPDQLPADNTEITAAPQQAAEPEDATPTASGTPSGDGQGRSTFAGLTIGERVANLGQLLGLGGNAASDSTEAAGNGSAKAAAGGMKRFLSSNSMDGSAARGLSRTSSGSQPMCLICLEPLTSEDFMVPPPPASDLSQSSRTAQ